MEEKVVLDSEDLARTLKRIAHEIVEKNPLGEGGEAGTGGSGLALVGIHTRGALIAARLHKLILEITGSDAPAIPLGDLDISFYRDDIDSRTADQQPVVHSSHLDFDLKNRTIVIVDDVLFTGRTVRAAIEALFDYGRPACVQLAVLVDRGHRELPLRPDFVGKNLPTSSDERVHVSLTEADGRDEVAISRPGDSGSDAK